MLWRSNQKTDLILTVFHLHAPIDPYRALRVVRQTFPIHKASYFMLFHKLRNDGLLMPCGKTVFVPETPEEKLDWDFKQICTQTYKPNGDVILD